MHNSGSTKEHLKDADSKIVFDKFHIAKHLSEAVDDVRRQENKQLRAEGDDSLVGTKYQWLRHPANFAADAWQEFKSLRESSLKTARAWALKETAMTLFTYSYTGRARSFFQRWYGWASRCRLKPMIEAGRMLKRRIENILTFIKHRITNAASESLNAKNPVGEIHRPWISQSDKLYQRDLLPLWWFGPGSLTH